MKFSKLTNAGLRWSSIERSSNITRLLLGRALFIVEFPPKLMEKCWWIDRNWKKVPRNTTRPLTFLRSFLHTIHFPQGNKKRIVVDKKATSFYLGAGNCQFYLTQSNGTCRNYLNRTCLLPSSRGRQATVGNATIGNALRSDNHTIFSDWSRPWRQVNVYLIALDPERRSGMKLLTNKFARTGLILLDRVWFNGYDFDFFKTVILCT